MFALNETWLTPDIPDNCLNIDSFHFVRNDRNFKSNKKKGSHFAKIFDKFVTSQLIDFLEDNNLLSHLQAGFRK